MCYIYIINLLIMKQESKKMTPDESLAIISEMINNLKEDYRANAYPFIFWGWIISLACISHFILILLLKHYELYSIIGLFSFLIWILFIGLGFVIHYIHLAKHKPRTRSLYNRFMKALWQAASLTMFVLAASCIKFEIYPPVFLLPTIGMATLISGLMVRFKPLIVGGLLFFAAAIITTFWLYEFSLLVNAIAIILGYLIPGYMLKNTKTANHV